MPRHKPLTRVEKLRRSDGALRVTFVNTGCAERQFLDGCGDLLAWRVAMAWPGRFSERPLLDGRELAKVVLFQPEDGRRRRQSPELPKEPPKPPLREPLTRLT